MNTPNTPVENAPSPDSPTNVPLLTIRGEVAAAIQALGIPDTISPQDRILLEALSASKNLVEIVRHAEELAENMAYMQKVPKNMDAMHEQLLVLQYQYHIDLIEAELRQDSPNRARITDSMRWALDIATTLAHPKPKGYGNDVPLKKARALQARIEALQS